MKPKNPPTPEKVKGTLLKAQSDDRVKIIHFQSVKQSANYQSADCSFGVEIMVENNDKAIQRGIDRAETIVEERLVAKLDTHRKLLRKLGA